MFFIDIDNTIAGRNILHFARYCNKHWNLGIADEQLRKGKVSYETFFQAPELAVFRSRLSNGEWEEVLQQAEQAPVVLARQRVLPSALQGVKTLAASAPLSYCTVRRDQEEVRQATCAWLTSQQFPSPQQVIFCRSLLGKLLAVYHHILETHEAVVLVDDLYVPLLKGFQQLVEGHHPRYSSTQCGKLVEVLREMMTLIAFQATTVPEESNGLRVLALPSWDRLDEVLPVLRL